MDKEAMREEIYEILKECVSLECRQVGSEYGAPGYVEVRLMLNNECVSSIYIDNSN